MQPDWFKQIKQPSDETTQEYLPRHPFKIILPFLILALLCCLWALLASHLGALMKASFFTCSSLYYWRTDCIYPELPKDCFIYTKF